MLYLTQLIYLKNGEEETFDAFEKIAIPIIARYNGKLLLRVRPGKDAVIEAGMEAPYEIHLIQFPTEADLTRFSADEERKNFLHLKDQSVRSSMLIGGKVI